MISELCRILTEIEAFREGARHSPWMRVGLWIRLSGKEKILLSAAKASGVKLNAFEQHIEGVRKFQTQKDQMHELKQAGTGVGSCSNTRQGRNQQDWPRVSTGSQVAGILGPRHLRRL